MSDKTKVLIESDKFVGFITTLILLNSLTLATEHYEQADWLTQTQDIANIVFTVLFALEMILSMIGLGIKGYFSQGFNIFDATIVFVSVFDLAFTINNPNGGTGSFVTVLRLSLIHI